MQMRSRPTRFLVAVTAGLAIIAGSFGTNAPAGAATPTNTDYVRSLYLDLLDRSDATADAAGIEYWADELDAGQSRATVVERIQRGGNEYYGTIVDFYYLAFLDRTAEPAGRTFYIDRWRDRRFTLERVTIALGESQEYYNRVGGTNASFVDAIFFDILGREPGAGDQAYYQGVVASGSRGRVASILVKSAEKRRMTAVDQYGTFLGRVPTATEREAAVTALGRGLTRSPGGLRREEFDASLLASDEYFINNT